MIEDPFVINQTKWNISNAGSFSENKIIETEFCVIGSGAGGAMSASLLAKAGFKVLIIEEGPLRSSKDFVMKESVAYPELYQESAGRKTKDEAINIFQGRSVGGSTTINWTTSFRTPDITLNYWRDEFGVKDLEPEKLQPIFERVEKEFSITPWTVTPNANNAMISAGCQALGLSWGVTNRNVKNCRNLGFCGVGCPVNAKQSSLVTKIPEALEHGAELISQLKANKFELRAGRIENLNCVAMEGNQERNINVMIKAKHFILAAGSIGSPAILLRSQVPDPYHLIGKRTFIHPVNVSAAITENAIFASSGAPQSIYSDHFLGPTSKADKVGFKLESAPIHPILLSQVIRSHGNKHFELMSQFPYISNMIALLRDGFHHEAQGGKVMLRSDGSPVLDYEITPYLWEGFKRAWLTMAEIQFAAGAKKVLPIHTEASLSTTFNEAKRVIENLSDKKLEAKLFSAHVMGGLGFGESEEKSVVDSYGKFRLLDNLTVVDGSVFPTSIGANPQQSIFTFSLRSTEKLIREWKAMKF